jgi:hypothetical protein
MNWSPVETRLAREAKRAITLFRRRHAGERVRCMAIDATPSDDFFAVCFDCRDNELVGNFTHHLFHEFAAGIKAPKDGWPKMPSGSRDGFVEAELRKILARVLRALADGGAFARLPTGKRLSVGYCYHDSVFVPCRTLRIKQPIEPAPRRRLSRAPIATDRAQEAFLADLATAYDRATPYFEAAHNGSKVDQHSARGLLYRLTWMAEHGTEIDERWIARTKAALKHPALSGYAKEFLTALK